MGIAANWVQQFVACFFFFRWFSYITCYYLRNIDSIDTLIATARSNKGATSLGVQDFSQLRKDYGKEQANVILNITGNIIIGQVTWDTAKKLSVKSGKIMQDTARHAINSADTSVVFSSN